MIYSCHQSQSHPSKNCSLLFSYSLFPSPTKKSCKMMMPLIYCATLSQCQNVAVCRLDMAANEQASIRNECWQNETLYFWAMKLQAGKPKAVSRCDWCDRGACLEKHSSVHHHSYLSIMSQERTRYKHQRWMIKLIEVLMSMPLLCCECYARYVWNTYWYSGTLLEY